MRKLELVWNKDLMIHEPKFVYQKENIPSKNKRYRGKNKIPNFQDKVRARREDKKGITAYQYACVITHRARFGVNPFLKVANNWS
tara:strand:- start:187 stop:441 length:255 start_codon:yes stop_codon:yes gene_type:complete